MANKKNGSNLLVRTKRPSSYLEGHIFQNEPRIEPRQGDFQGVFGQTETIVMSKKESFPYKLAQLSDAGGDPSKRWRIIFYVWDINSNSLVKKQKWISSKFTTKAQKTAEANRLIKSINQLLVEGYHIGQPTPKKAINQTLWTWVEAFDWVYKHREPSIRKRSQQTMELVRRELKVWLKLQGILHLPISQVRYEHCDEYMQWLRRDRNLSNTTYNNYLSFLKLNFNYLVSQQKLDYSPATRLKTLNIEESENVHFPKKVKNKLLEAYPESLRIVAQYIYYTFIRPGELRKLQVRHVHEKSIFIPGNISKNRKSAHVIITPAMERLLQELQVRKMPPSYFLIGEQGKPSQRQIGINYFTAMHLKIRKALDLGEEYTLYCWKHTGVTDTYRQTRDIDFVSRQCRHSSLDMTKRYLRGLGLLLDYPHQDELPDLGL